MLKGKILVTVFFVCYFILGLSIYKDYGISYDEPATRLNGMVNSLYILDFIKPDLSEKIRTENNIKKLSEYGEKDYGATFDIITVVVEFAFNIKDKQHIFMMRHLLNFLLFFISTIFMYRLCLLLFKERRWALLSALIYVLHPKIFAESFYNSKDLTFLSAIVISNYYCLKFIYKSTIKTAAAAGLSIAFAITIRVMAIMIPVITLFIIGLQILFNQKRNYKPILIFIACSLVFTYLMWPLLWENPIENFLMVFKSMSKYKWNSPVYYMGVHIRASVLPWHYLPICFIVSTPFIFLLGGTLGGLILLVRLAKSKFSDVLNLQLLYLLGVFILPIMAIILLHSVVYGGWRHVYFIYAGFVPFVVFGFKSAYEFCKNKFNNTWQMVSISVCAICIIQLSFTVFKLHPYQNVYFNFLAGAEPKFEYDYWDLSYTKGLRHVLLKDNSKNVKIYFHGSKIAIYMLTPKERERIEIVDTPEDANYFFSTYYVGPNDAFPFKNSSRFYTIQSGQLPILNIFKLGI